MPLSKTLFSLCAAAACVAAQSAGASHFEDGYRAYKKGDYAAALKEWQAGADAGQVESTYELGIMFRDGEGVTRDPAKAFALNMRAAEAGYYRAIQNVIAYYHEGIGVKANDVEATRWVRRAADGSSSDAMRSYARVLLLGAGTTADKAGSADWFEKSFLYDDFTTATLLVSESDWEKYPFTTNGYDELIENGELPKPDLKARFQAILARADAGDAEAQFQAAMMYYIGRGTKSDLAKMVEYLRRSADQGHAMAQFRLANTYIQGMGGNPRDEKKAMDWLYKSSLQKNAFALSLLGVSYMGGVGVREDRAVGLALMMLGTLYGDKETSKLVLRSRLAAPAADVDAAVAIELKCLSNGMQACLPSR